MSNKQVRKVRRKGEKVPVFYSTLIQESADYFIVRSPGGALGAVPKREYELVPEPRRVWVDITDQCGVEDGHLFDQTNILCQRLICGPNAPVTQGYRIVNTIALNASGSLKGFGIQREDIVQP